MTTLQTLSFNKMNRLNMNVQLRRFPYPYKAMLAICSDLDETQDKNVYYEIMRFLNTTKDTTMGLGVGLEVGNSIYFDMPPEQFAYFNIDDTGKEMVRTLIKSGHIDCLHSYGDLALKRKDVAKALDELDKYGCKLEVWVDHGTAPTNFGSDIMAGHGDELGHEAYHSDLTTDYGIKYIWRGRVTSITGQDIPSKLSGIFKRKHPIRSGSTLLKEATKRKLALKGNCKYAMHGTNETIRQRVLRDGSYVYEFMRCNPHWGGISSCEEGRHIGQVLTDDFLNRLIDRGGSCILYTHLGKVDNPKVPFNKKAVLAFRQLAELYREGKILVTTTRRLLGYRRAIREIKFNSTENESGLQIDIETSATANSIGELDTKDLYGLTFYVSEPEVVSMTIDGKEITDLQRNELDHTDRPSVSLPWPTLEFPQI